MATVEFDKVSKIFDGVRALDDVSFAVGEGEFVVLVGPSGCGKSTALRIVAGLEFADTGQIRINGQDVTERPPKSRGCAMVFQSYALYPHWTVFDNLAFPLRVRHTPADEIRKRVTAIANDLQLGEVLDRRPKALSGGQRQRVALGRAMAADPAIFLFDEPLSNLDAPLRAGMRAEIVARQKSLGKTSLYVTHDQAEALTMADRIVVLEGGHVRGIGHPEELYRNPPNLFVASFLGRPTINLISGTITRLGDTLTLSPLGWTLPSELGAGSFDRKEVVVGIRAENLRISRGNEIANGRITGREFLGDRNQYRLESATGALTALTPPDIEFAAGESIGVVPDPAGIMLFHPENGNRITPLV